MDYALINRPLSREFQARFEDLMGEAPQYLSLTELRRLPPVGLFRLLRTLRADRLLLPVEDGSSKALLPVLRGLAALADARQVEVVHPDLQREGVSRWQALVFLASLPGASLGGMLDAKGCSRELACLLRSRRIAPVVNATPRVLYLNANLWFGVKAGGSVGHIAGVLNGLARQGYRVDYSALSPSAVADPAIGFHPLRAPRVFGIPAELNYYRFQREVVRQWRGQPELAEHGLIYQRLSLANYAGVVLSRRSDLPLIVEYNGSEVWATRNWGTPLRRYDLAMAAEEACLKHAHLIVTVSDVLVDELVSRGVERERIVCYPNGIDPQLFDPGRFSEADRQALRCKYRIADGAIIAGFIGTFGPWHGVDRLAEAIVQMVEGGPAWLAVRKLHFLLVGDGVNGARVREQLAASRFAPFCTLTGAVPQDQAPAHLAICDFVLSPHVPNPDGSPFFGSPTKLFEYMAMGQAILASDLGQIGQVLTPALRVGSLPSRAPRPADTEQAVLCRPGDVDELVQGIRFLAENEGWRRQLGMNARREALARYTWTHHVQAILEGLHRSLSEGTDR